MSLKQKQSNGRTFLFFLLFAAAGLVCGCFFIIYMFVTKGYYP